MQRRQTRPGVSRPARGARRLRPASSAGRRRSRPTRACPGSPWRRAARSRSRAARRPRRGRSGRRPCSPPGRVSDDGTQPAAACTRAPRGMLAWVSDTTLSDELESFLQEEDVTLGRLNGMLDERSFALVLMLLMLPSALPLPTGGVTHVLELFAIVVVLQMIVGRTELWLPRRLADHRLGTMFTDKAAPRLLRFVRWVERHARPRGARLLGTRLAVSVLGVVLLLFVLGALVAPPFSG